MYPVDSGGYKPTGLWCRDFRLEGYSPAYLRMGGQWRDHERYAITGEEARQRKGCPLGAFRLGRITRLTR